jgi:hypothetical protein
MQKPLEITTTRDKYLTEAMGYESYLGLERYVHPEKPYLEFSEPKEGINFSSWYGFGKLWEWSQKQEWRKDFFERVDYWHDDLDEIINPDRFADAVHKFLKESS